MKKPIIVIALLCAFGAASANPASTTVGEPSSLLEASARAERYREIVMLTKEAQDGNPSAQLALGKTYDPRFAKHESEADLRAASGWYLRAALQGSVEAQNELGQLYAETQNHVMAYAWLSIASKNRLEPKARKVFEDLARTLTPEQKADGIWFAQELTSKHPAVTRKE